MLIVEVAISVLPEHVEAFVTATRENAEHSLREPGIARFDLLRSLDDPHRFLLVEAYRTEDAPAAHKATAHYAKWRDTVAPMMAAPRSAAKYENLFPSDVRYATPDAE